MWSIDLGKTKPKNLISIQKIIYIRVQTSWKFEVFSKNVDCSWVRVFTLRSTPGKFETRLCYCFCRVECCGLEFGIFGEFGWVRSLVLVGKPGFKRVRSSQFEIHYFWVQPNTKPYQELSEYVISSSRGNYFTRLLSFGRSVKYKYRAMNNFFSSEDSQPNMFKSETDNLI